MQPGPILIPEEADQVQEYKHAGLGRQGNRGVGGDHQLPHRRDRGEVPVPLPLALAVLMLLLYSGL